MLAGSVWNAVFRARKTKLRLISCSIRTLACICYCLAHSFLLLPPDLFLLHCFAQDTMDFFP